MIRYYKKIGFLKVSENWFEYKFRLADVVGLSVYWNVKKPAKVRAPMVKTVSHSLELDLRGGMEPILDKYTKQTRQQVRIAETEGVTCVHDQNIDLFVEFYNDFARKRKTFLVSRHQIEGTGDALQLSFAFFKGEVIVAHSYLADKEAGIVRHHHAATRRLEEEVDKNLIGRANKYLTTANIQRFMDAGYHTFDFGGYAKDTEDKGLQGINKYKEQFGGILVESHNYFSYPYWIFKQLSRLLGTTGKLS